MFGTHDLVLFIISGLLLNITPGADFLYIFSRSVGQGVTAGVWAALGVAAGCCVHIFAAAVGLSAIIATSAPAFTVVKWCGAAYLLYLGVSLLLTRPAPPGPATHMPRDAAGRIFWQGFLTNALNPKVALFFLAFVPQFIDTASQSKVAAFLFLGAVFNINGLLWNVLVAWTAARVFSRLGAAVHATRWINRLLGVSFVGLGLRLAFGTRA
jgi:threonine/homoserine/homoserine lactone efflux protein